MQYLNIFRQITARGVVAGSGGGYGSVLRKELEISMSIGLEQKEA